MMGHASPCNISAVKSAHVGCSYKLNQFASISVICTHKGIIDDLIVLCGMCSVHTLARL